MSSHLLPPSATAAERALAEAVARVAAVPVPVGEMWSPADCPSASLPWLAWALSVDEWDSGWSDAVQREAIAASVDLHRKKGTLWAVRRALTAAGYADARVVEGLPWLRHDGEALYDGADTYAGGGRWALFEVTAELGETQGVSRSGRETLLRLVAGAKPARCHLRAVAFACPTADALAAGDATDTALDLEAGDDAVFGRCYDAAICHDQATPATVHDPVGYDGAWRHDGAQDYDGWHRYTLWTDIGECYANRRCTMVFGPAVTATADACAAAAPGHDGRAVHDGAARYGDAGAAGLDVLAMSLVRRVRYDRRHVYDGWLRHSATRVEALTA
jgi:phage tail P2-like protein